MLTDERREALIMLATKHIGDKRVREQTASEVRALISVVSASAAPAEGRDAVDERAAKPHLKNFRIEPEWIERMAEKVGDEPCGILAISPEIYSEMTASCLCCGQIGKKAAWHIEHPDIYVCETCKQARAALATAPTMSERAKSPAAYVGWAGEGKPKALLLTDDLPVGTALYTHSDRATFSDAARDAKRYAVVRLKPYVYGVANPTPEQFDKLADAEIERIDRANAGERES